MSADESRHRMNAEEAWTRVESRQRTSSRNVATSDAGLTTTTSMDDDASSVSGLDKSVNDVNRAMAKPKTLAEKLLPKGRKTEVDDILETPHYPELSRTMRITSPSQQPATGYSWEDYEDADDVRGMDADREDDGGWDVAVIKSRGKAKHSRPTTDKAAESKTKKQTQNQARTEAEKTARNEAEQQRQEILANHRREREKALLDEQLKKKAKKQSVLSGGMKATVDTRGNLVWED